MAWLVLALSAWSLLCYIVGNRDNATERYKSEKESEAKGWRAGFIAGRVDERQRHILGPQKPN